MAIYLSIPRRIQDEFFDADIISALDFQFLFGFKRYCTQHLCP